MKNKLFLLFGFFFLLMGGNPLQAQQLRSSYPVQVNAVLLPPYSLYLSDYCNSPKGKIILTLLNRDLVQGDVNVRLHLSIHAGNLRMETKDFNVLPVYTLQPGVPVSISPSDLCPYFQPANLNITGAFDGKFPEGMIEICFSVYEVRTGALISQTSCARAWVTLNRPPLLSLPLNKTNYPFREPQQIVFQWTPRHQALSNVEYEFTLKEIYNANAGIENAFAYSTTLYSTTVSGTSFAYNTAIHPPFLEDRTYAWQVRAVVRDGFEELNVFENNGFSEIYSFSLMPACKPPVSPSAIQEGNHERIDWTPSDPARQQVVAYRSKENNGPWHVQKANLNYANILDVAVGQVIEYKVGTVCVDGTIVYSDVQTFILEDWREELMAKCGSGNQPGITNRTPIPELNFGDVFFSAGVPVTVTGVSGKNGIFSGYGWMEISVLASAKIACKFTNVQINTDKQQFAGTVESVYDKNESQIKDMDFIDQGGTNTGQTKTGDIWTDVKTDISIPPDGKLSYDPEKGVIIVTDKDGNPVGEIPLTEEAKNKLNGTGENGGASITIEDKDGNIYTITKGEDGKVTAEQTGSTGGGGATSGQFDPTTVNSKDAIVLFSKGINGYYAFDEWNESYTNILLIRDKYEHLGNYNVPAKLIPPGRTDKVAFTVNIINKDKIDPSKIIFRSGTGTEYIAKEGEISITGGRENDAQDIYALYPEGNGKFQTLGKLKVLSYKELNLNLTLVKVKNNTVNRDDVEVKLNEVYGPLGIHWTVSEDNNFNYTEENMDSESSGLFSRETDEMKAINAAYKATGRVDKNTVYLFILKSGNIKEKNLAGDMPRGKQFGYIFTSGQSQESINRSIAHEVGHGKFKLRHTFDSDYGGILKECSTNNLMDYGTGTYLAKWQWDMLFDPAILVSPFEGDESGMAQGTGQSSEKGIVIPEERIFVAPDKSLVKLPANAEILYYCPQDEDNIKGYGYLYKFRIGNDIWTGDIKKYNPIDDFSFGGYYSGNQKYNQGGGQVQAGSEVWKVTQLIEYDKDYQTIKSRKLSIRKIRVKSLSYPNYYDESESLTAEETKEAISNCGGSGSGVNNNLQNNLQILTASARSGQSVELESWEGNVLKIYTLKNGKPVEVDKPLTDSEIENGKWTDAAESKIRYTVNKNGIIQIKSLGFRQSLKLAEGKQADLPGLSKHIKDQTNKLLEERKVSNFSTQVAQTSSETFADGGQIVIGGNNTTYSKLISEGIGLTATLLKTGEIEESAYLKSTEKTVSIHAPGVVTGSIEVVAQKVTDLTGLGCLVYDVAFDEDTRSQLYSQCKAIKDEIGEDPLNFLPILGNVVLTVATRNTAEQWQATIDGTTDTGKRSHLATRGTGNAILTAMAGVAIVKNLPEITEKLAENIKKVKKGLSSLSEFVAKSLAEKLEDIKNIWKTKYPVWEMMEGRTFFEDIMGEYRYTKAEGWAHTADIADNFKGVDFYKGVTQGEKIYAETAVSMKTTITTDVNTWLNSQPIKDNLRFLQEGFTEQGLRSNGKIMSFEKAEIHIYMPKENITPTLNTEWMNKLNAVDPKIKFEIKSLEEFIK